MEELEFYKEWCLAHLEFEKEITANSRFLDEDAINRLIVGLDEIEKKIITYYNNKNLKRLKYCFSCYLQDACLPDEPEYPILNARLRAACGKDLRDFDKKRLTRVQKVEERGYIKTNSEFYLIRSHIDYLEATNGTDEEIIKFDTMISQYEQRVSEKMEKQKKKKKQT